MAEVRAQVIGAGRLAERMVGAAAELPQVVRSEMSGRMGSGLRRVYESVAPIRSGRLRRKLDTQVRGMTLEVTSPVRSDEGFPYTRITRFGHRVDRIYAKRGQALKFTIGGRTLYRRSVKGYKPDHDWAEEAVPRARSEVAGAAERVGRTTARRITG